MRHDVLWVVLMWLLLAINTSVPVAGQDTEPSTEPDDVVIESDPVVLLIQQSEPTTPADLIQAAVNLLNLNRPELAQGYLKKLQGSQLTEAQLSQLVKKLGSAVFIRLSRAQRIEPDIRQIAVTALEAADRSSRDPQRIESLVAGLLDDPSAATRRAALVELRGTPTVAVGPLLRGLQADLAADRAARARGALVSLGQPVVEPLIGFLGSPDPKLRSEAIRILGRLQVDRATEYLLRPYLSPESTIELRRAASSALQSIVGSVPTLPEAKELLDRQIHSLLDGESFPQKPDHEGKITLWRWDATNSTAAPVEFPSRDAAVVVAADLAADLYHLSTGQPEHQRLFLLAQLEAEKLLSGLDHPLATDAGTPYAVAVAAGPNTVEQVLSDALRGGYVAAAVGAADVLGEIGDSTLLFGQLGRERPLARALDHSNRWLRVAAARAIMKIDPRAAYPGASQLIQLIRYLTTTQGTRRALVGNPNVDDVSLVAGMLRGLGYEADAATTGQRLAKMALKNCDYEFFLISDTIDSPRTSELMQHLRKYANTSDKPIGLLTRATTYLQYEQLARGDDLTLAFPRPHDRDTLALLVQRLHGLAGSGRASGDQRLKHAAEALQWLDHLASDRAKYRFYDLTTLQPAVVAALDIPELTAAAARVLAKFGTARAQTALVELASQNTRPIGQRQAAATALVESIARWNVQLTSQQILLQYDRYNESANLDKPTQQVLGSVWDSIKGAHSDRTSQ